MRLKNIAIIALLVFLQNKLHAQVWFPEGVYTQNAPFLITVDNQVITIAKASVNANFSYWQVCVNDGKSWKKLPLLTLSKSAEIMDIKKFGGMIYVCGNFTFDNGAYNGLVRFNTINWQGLSTFKKSAGQVLCPVLSMDVHNGTLVLGGSFYTIGNDTIPYLARFNGLKFSEYFDQCKSCGPDNAVNDIASNDSVVVIAGQFTNINNHKSKYLYRLIKQTKGDTFINTPRIIEKLALDGTTIYGTGGIIKDKRVYKITNTITDINLNIDSTYTIFEILVLEGKPIVNGVFSIGTKLYQYGILRLENSTWINIMNNYSNANHIATGRSMLFAVGTPSNPLSIWNPNRFVVRFYPNLALVKAKVYIDSNNNCIQEPNEKPLSKQYIKLPLINKGVFTNEKGQAEFLVPNGTQGTFRFVVKPFRNMVRSNCADTVVNKTFYPGVYSDSIQFPLNRLPNINDIRIFLSSPRGKQVVKNKKVLYYITYENVGSNPISGNIKLEKSALFTKESSSPLHTLRPNDSTLIWTYTNLQPGEKKMIVYSAYPENVQFDQQMQFEAKVASSISTGSSSYSFDDFDSIPQQVDQTLEAFRKDVFPTPSLGDSITYLDKSDRDLRYNISFNNFTTDTVFYAVVIDTLDLNLDMSYIEETGSNKGYFTEVQTDPNNQYKGILIWHFPNIRLVPNPTMDYENSASGSYIGFKVVTKPLSQGYYLRNTASVYFDNNFAGNTNSVYCALAINGINRVDFENEALKLYPNPFTDAVELLFDLKQGDEIKLLDMNGKEVYAETVANNASLYTIACGHIPAGIYVIQIVSNGSLISRKLVKMN